MLYAVFPVGHIPNWGASYAASRTSNRNTMYAEYVSVPSYNLQLLTIPMRSLLTPWNDKNIPIITAKLFYSTRYYGKYDLDAGEFSGIHNGIDLKLNYGTPIGSIAGGRVQTVNSTGPLGRHIIIEHHTPNRSTFFSIYGHLAKIFVNPGDPVKPGQIIGTVGLTGNTTAPHLHLQVDRKISGEKSPHEPFWPTKYLTPEEANVYSINPIVFIRYFAAPVWM